MSHGSSAAVVGVAVALREALGAWIKLDDALAPQVFLPKPIITDLASSSPRSSSSLSPVDVTVDDDVHLVDAQGTPGPTIGRDDIDPDFVHVVAPGHVPDH
jgi:hypothetical protein